ncbi:MAG: GGDEF domain-containing protein [Clostridia bacterium]|nr:GGDEF domain-containing protein [Clostridia bacterium]
MKQKKKNVGVSAKLITLPIIAVLLVLHVVNTILILHISAANTSVIDIMHKSDQYTQESTELVSGITTLSETSMNFVMRPDGPAAESVLGAFADELIFKSYRRSDKILDKFKTYDIPEAAMDKLEIAVEKSEEMFRTQKHAIALCLSSRENIEIDSDLIGYTLSAAEIEMSAPQRDGLAQSMLLSEQYSLARRDVAANVGTCNGIIQTNSGEKAEEISRQVRVERVVMWSCTIVIALIFLASAASIYWQIIRPLTSMAHAIPAGSTLNEEHGLQEVRTVARAYNVIYKRRESLDAILRSAAETDALTGLPNRYCFEQYVLESEKSESSAAVVLFDINYLKKTNDTKGHSAGDELICAVANCISTCFGKDSFRFGGDEFVSVVKDCPKESVAEMVKNFEKEEKERDISVSFGWAYTDKISDTNLKTLMQEADKKMYERKKNFYKGGGNPAL